MFNEVEKKNIVKYALPVGTYNQCVSVFNWLLPSPWEPIVFCSHRNVLLFFFCFSNNNNNINTKQVHNMVQYLQQQHLHYWIALSDKSKAHREIILLYTDCLLYGLMNETKFFNWENVTFAFKKCLSIPIKTI